MVSNLSLIHIYVFKSIICTITFIIHYLTMLPLSAKPKTTSLCVFRCGTNRSDVSARKPAVLFTSRIGWKGIYIYTKYKLVCIHIYSICGSLYIFILHDRMYDWSLLGNTSTKGQICVSLALCSLVIAHGHITHLASLKFMFSSI